jgi:hypothetical protein
MVVKSVQVGEKVLQGSPKQLQGLSIARFLTRDEKLFPKHLQNGGSIQTWGEEGEEEEVG